MNAVQIAELFDQKLTAALAKMNQQVAQTVPSASAALPIIPQQKWDHRGQAAAPPMTQMVLTPGTVLNDSHVVVTSEPIKRYHRDRDAQGRSVKTSVLEDTGRRLSSKANRGLVGFRDDNLSVDGAVPPGTRIHIVAIVE